MKLFLSNKDPTGITSCRIFPFYLINFTVSFASECDDGVFAGGNFGGNESCDKGE